MDVCLTVDTEISRVRVPDWRETQLAAEVRRDIFGHTGAGDFGIVYQMRLLNAYGLKATYFVESLFASVVGLEPLRTIVDAVVTHGHDMQLHAHPNWLDWLRDPDSSPADERTMCSFTLPEQIALIAEGKHNLERCGVPRVSAFRAGDFNANGDTIRAVRLHQIPFDSSINPAYGNKGRPIAERPLLAATRIHGVTEFPVTTFRCAGGSLRPLQVCACSSGELESLLLHAWKAQWRSATILLHSFELIVRPNAPGRFGRPAPVRRRRFERLCRFLGTHRDQLRTRTFAELAGAPDAALLAVDVQPEPLGVPLHHTVYRYLEQAADRALSIRRPPTPRP
jgi:hypothetical protein